MAVLCFSQTLAPTLHFIEFPGRERVICTPRLQITAQSVAQPRKEKSFEWPQVAAGAQQQQRVETQKMRCFFLFISFKSFIQVMTFALMFYCPQIPMIYTVFTIISDDVCHRKSEQTAHDSRIACFSHSPGVKLSIYSSSEVHFIHIKVFDSFLTILTSLSSLA